MLYHLQDFAQHSPFIQKPIPALIDDWIFEGTGYSIIMQNNCLIAFFPYVNPKIAKQRFDGFGLSESRSDGMENLSIFFSKPHIQAILIHSFPFMHSWDDFREEGMAILI